MMKMMKRMGGMKALGRHGRPALTAAHAAGDRPSRQQRLSHMDIYWIFGIAVRAGGGDLLAAAAPDRGSPTRSTPSDRIDTLIGWPPEATRILRTPERLAYSTLKLALPGYMILAQVPLARFLNVPKRNSYAEWMRAPRQPVRRFRRLRRDLAGRRGGRHPAARCAAERAAAAPPRPGRAVAEVGRTSRCTCGTRNRCRRSRRRARASCRMRRPFRPRSHRAAPSAEAAVGARRTRATPFDDTDPRRRRDEDMVEVIELARAARRRPGSTSSIRSRRTLPPPTRRARSRTARDRRHVGCPPSRSCGVARQAEQSLRELARVERLQVLELLADADEVDRERPLARDRAHSAIAASTPPFAVPSSLVTTSPVSCSAASNACTCASAFWPVLPSMTSSTSCGAPGSRLARSRAGSSSAPPSGAPASCRRPAVSAMTTSQPRAFAGDDRVEGHAGRIAAFLADDLDRRPLRSPAGRRDRPRPRAARAPRRGTCRPPRAAPSGRLDEVARELADASSSCRRR